MPTTGKNADVEKTIDQALAQSPTLFEEAGLLVATVFSVAVLLPLVL